MFRKGCASSFTGLLVIKERRLNYKPFVTLKDVFVTLKDVLPVSPVSSVGRAPVC